MATNTTNYDLIKPEYADAADIADINSNMDVIDGAMNDNATAISSANTIITAHSQSIATNTEAIATNAAAISSNSEAISNNTTAIASNTAEIENYRMPTGLLKQIGSKNLNTFYESGRFYCVGCTNLPEGTNGYLDNYVYYVSSGNSYVRQIFLSPTSNKLWERVLAGTTWTSWGLLVRENDINNKIYFLYLTDQTINNGYIAINYPSGVTNDSHQLIIQQVYTGGTNPGYVFTVQQQATNIVIYIRTVTTENGVPADGSKVSMCLMFIKKTI